MRLLVLYGERRVGEYALGGEVCLTASVWAVAPLVLAVSVCGSDSAAVVFCPVAALGWWWWWRMW